MKKETLISAIFLASGFLLEYLYYSTESTLFGIKFYLLGAICIGVGFLGLWIYTIMPFINSRFISKKK